MKPTLLSLFVILFVFAARAQYPQIEWQNSIGGNLFNSLLAIHQTTDGGYILGGDSDSGISGDKTEDRQGSGDYWVIKLDTAGQIVWQNTIGGDNNESLTSIHQTTDGGYILGGYSYSGISGDKTEASQGSWDYWVIKLDDAGNIIWQNTIGGNGSDYFTAIQQTTDGGYILGGYSRSDISGDKTEAAHNSDYWVIKLDDAGNIIWQNTIGGLGDDELRSLQQTADGGYILGGSSYSDIYGDKTENSQGSWDYWVIKLDGAGNIIWQNTIGGANADYLYSIQETKDGGYILGGYSHSGISGDKAEANLDSVALPYPNSDYWVIKLNAAGNIIWQNTIGGSDDDQLQSIRQTADGGYILGGYTESGISGDKTEATYGFRDYWVLKLDAFGIILWQNTLGGSGDDQLQSIQQTADGGYILGGHSSSDISVDKTENNNGFYDYWVVKLSTDTNAVIISGSIITEAGSPIAGIAVNLTDNGNITGSMTTESNGRYAFQVAKSGSYTISPSKSNDINPNNGITAVDVLLMRRHILGNALLNSPYKIITAAELNAEGDTTITNNDVLLARSMILGNITSFPTDRLWQFVPSDHVFPDNNHPFPFPTSRTYTNITTNQTNQDFIGIKLGDVNGSWDGNVP